MRLRVGYAGTAKRFGAIALLLVGWAVQAGAQSDNVRGGVPSAEWKQLASPEQAGWSAEKRPECRRAG